MRTKYEDRELTSNDSSENLLEGIGEYWGGFYLANPHRFALDYFEFPLHIFQQILIYFMFKSDQFLMSCTRGLGGIFLSKMQVNKYLDRNKNSCLVVYKA